jgi:hypothetical protein
MVSDRRPGSLRRRHATRQAPFRLLILTHQHDHIQKGRIFSEARRRMVDTGYAAEEAQRTFFRPRLQTAAI